ncbi:putative tyrosine-protein phosphatase capC [Staphylococcus piscifermentans]|uniref:Tyrosine-protein phosphatase n=1 Tax=Staphylococcus piscifermentans TaxID=70258 RepID=A0A239U6X7_9STAP|nr:CpsB/CapC family capsule biosynthesis tyrosine phosphatase [Staphylococcus piscifermentans]RTX85813.1 capsular biosynthesis protein [Staphylococcus piscifermentans]GEP84175.1 capsular polysaccharide biosynthesis protein Cap8C [Staphylococcus piscifermentans]SNV05690.1 putative tyrosine-protein phosphatase capC [Staphylococcus piscifermentans]
MIDIHSHILINIDDGAQSSTEAIELIQQAEEEGITGIIATPHFTSHFPNTFDKVELKIKELCNLREVEHSNIKLYPGQEVRISEDLISHLENGDIKGLNHSRYILVEFPPNEIPQYTKQVFKDLKSKGYIPIIAHPERNQAIIQDMHLLFELVSEGALSQITSSSLGGYFGRTLQKSAIEMIQCNLAHFIASDAHHIGYRPFIMASLFEEKHLVKLHEVMREIIQNAELIIDNKIIKRKPPQLPTKQRSIRRFSF